MLYLISVGPLVAVQRGIRGRVRKRGAGVGEIAPHADDPGGLKEIRSHAYSPTEER